MSVPADEVPLEGLQERRAEVVAHQQAIRKIEADLRVRLTEKKELESTGLFSMFRAAPDPGRVEELSTEVQILKLELKMRREELAVVRKEMERLEHVARQRSLPERVNSTEEAARHLQAFTRLTQLLTELQAMAGSAARARAAQRRVRSRRRVGPSLPRMNGAVAAHTERWEPVLDEAEALADLVGLVVAFPRRYPPMARPPDAVAAPADVAAARRAAMTGSTDFGSMIESVVPKVQQVQTQCTYTRESLRQRFPEASAVAAALPSLLSRGSVSTAPVSADPAQHLVEQWQALRPLYQTICAISAAGGRTVAYLEPVGKWQYHAGAVRDSELAQEHGLCPPINEGDLTAFVSRLQAEWAALDARFAGHYPDT